MTPKIATKVKRVMTDLMGLSVGASWADTIVETIFNEVLEEIEYSMGEVINEDDITPECVQSHMGEVLYRRLDTRL